MLKDFIYQVPVKVVFGMGKISEIGLYAKQWGSKALIVTTGIFFKETGLVDRIQKLLAENGIRSEYFYQVNPNPLSTQIDQGAEFARATACDMLIGLGGGSAIDAAKAIAIAAGHGTSIWNFAAGCVENPLEPTETTLPIIAVTTTSGTGSHITCYSVVTNAETKQKPGLGHPIIYPKVAIVDPELMISMPEKITAATGFDVFAHALEAYTSNAATPITDLYCEEAIRLVGKYLRRAVNDGKDLEARAAMAYADTLSGFAITIAVVTLCHGIAHAVGGVCDTVHGETLAAVTPYTMEFSMVKRPEKFKKIGALLRGDCCFCDDGDIDKLLQDSILEVNKLIKDIGMDMPLRDQGVKEEDLERIAEGAVGYMAGALDLDANRAGKEDVMNILKKAF